MNGLSIPYVGILRDGSRGHQGNTVSDIHAAQVLCTIRPPRATKASVALHTYDSQGKIDSAGVAPPGQQRTSRYEENVQDFLL